MIMMEKFPGAEDFEDQRILGMAPSMNKWMSRVMTELVKVHMKKHVKERVVKLGFQKGLGSQTVHSLVRESFWIASVWRLRVCMASADLLKFST